MREIQYIEGQTDTLAVYKIDKIRLSGGTGRQQVYRVHFISREALEIVLQEYLKHFLVLLKMQ